MAEDDMLLRTKNKQDQLNSPMVFENNVYADALEDMLKRDSELQESTFKFWGVTYKDSQEMTAVKASMHDVTKSMFGEMPSTQDEFHEALDQILAIYGTLISNCEAYIEKSGNPITPAGRERLRMVRGTCSLAKKETSLFKEKAIDMFDRTGGEGIFWVNVLGEIRMAEIDMDNAEVRLGGAGTSEVTIIGHGDDTKFFKDEEKLLAPTKEIKNRYIDTNSSHMKACSTILDALGDIIDNPFCGEIMGLKHGADSIERGNDDNTVFEMMKKDHVLLEVHLDWEDAEIRAALREILPRLARWSTRSGLCGPLNANISEGSLLSTRNVATSRMASLLNMHDFVADSKTVVLKKTGAPERRGNVMKKAIGTSLPEVLKGGKPTEYTPEMVRQLSMLQVLDTICGQIDRNSTNIFVTTREENGVVHLTGLQGIDNDLSFGDLTYSSLTQDNSGVNMLPTFEVNKNGEKRCSLPALDGNLVAAISALNHETVTHVFADLLSQNELAALIDRIDGVVKAIKTAAEKNPDIIVPSNKWDKQVAERFRPAAAHVSKGYVDSTRLAV
ncbi:MAG: hypothetical protein RSC52_04305 [Oscillospiraceae bacterium]